MKMIMGKVVVVGLGLVSVALASGSLRSSETKEGTGEAVKTTPPPPDSTNSMSYQLDDGYDNNNCTTSCTKMDCGSRIPTHQVWWPSTTNECGWYDRPCVVGMNGVTDKKNKYCDDDFGCFAVTHTRAKKTSALCTGGECPEMRRTIMVRVHSNTASTTRKFDFNTLGFKELCPYTCSKNGTNEDAKFCVDKPSHCTVVEPNNRLSNIAVPGSVMTYQGESLLIGWKQVDCDDGRELLGGEAGGYGGVGTVPVHPDGAASVAVSLSVLSLTTFLSIWF